MATYDELLNTANNAALNNKIRFGVVVAAEKIRTEDPGTPNHAARIEWARSVFQNPLRVSETMIWPVLAQNRAFTVAQITGADDATVQTAVDAAVNAFAF